jgi:hypothetical protein
MENIRKKLIRKQELARELPHPTPIATVQRRVLRIGSLNPGLSVNQGLTQIDKNKTSMLTLPSKADLQNIVFIIPTPEHMTSCSDTGGARRIALHA